MPVKKLSFIAGLKAFLMTILVSHPVWADDTEIFFSTLSATETQPNILFVLDASDSMQNYDCDDGTKSNRSCEDGTPNGTTTRLERMITAMNEVLDSISNVNVGLMRFGGFDGGRIILPITDLDGDLCNGTECSDDMEFVAESSITSTENDAFQVTSGDVTTTAPNIPLMDATGIDLVSNALRFTNLKIPQGATITDARVVFHSVADRAGHPDLKFRIEDAGNSAEYVDGSNNTITNRPWNGLQVNWSGPDAVDWTDGEFYESPDLSSLLDIVVNRPDWCGGNAVSLEVVGAGNRLAAAFGKPDYVAPSLRVSYKMVDVPATGGCIHKHKILNIKKSSADAFEQKWDGAIQDTKGEARVSPSAAGHRTAGFQFDEVPFAQGVKLVSASFNGSRGWNYANTGDMYEAHVAFEDSGNPAPFTATPYDLSSRTVTAGLNWSIGSAGETERISSPDLSAELENIFAKADWAEGNSVSVIMKPVGGSGGRSFLTYDSWRPTFAAELDVVYEGAVRTSAELVSDVRTRISSELDQIRLVLGTPTVGALEEAMRYYAGLSVEIGKDRAVTTSADDPASSRVSAPGSYVGGNVIRGPECVDSNLNSVHCATEGIQGNPIYVSPIKQECQANHIVLLTDGGPWQQTNAAFDAAIGRIETLNGGPCDTDIPTQYGKCGEEISRYMYETDFGQSPAVHMPGVDPSQIQNITTHSIGFNVKNDWIEDVAIAGGGLYTTAESTAELVEALSSIVALASDSSSTFVAPAVTVDQYSRISHREDVYLALFSPRTSASWKGNLKRYSLKQGTEIALHGQNGIAVDRDTGEFLPTAKSYWSPDADGGNTELGGAASQLDPSDRNVVTYIDGAVSTLLATANEISIGNDDVTAASLGVGSAVDRARLINWLIGYDEKDENEDGSTDDTRHHLGDPLHSSPVLITYDDDPESAEGDSVVYVGTNEGFLHGFNNGDGSETFAFMPYELLDNVSVLFADQSIVKTDRKPYGMDGDLSVWKDDVNGNGLIDGDDEAIIIAGMRRGGRSYYALDVSDRESPDFKWSIEGGSGDFVELGQTWSKPFTGKISDGGVLKNVVVFAGGYDPAQDTKLERGADGIGRALYIVDLETGNLIWSAEPDTFPAMQYSIPSDVKVVTDGKDNLISQIYVGDTGGQIWRFDVKNGESGTDLVDGGVIADLSEDASTVGNRRFYHAPDLSIVRDGSKRILNIAIGSGYHAHPLDTAIKDKFFVIRYPYEYQGAGKYGFQDDDGDYNVITVADLFDTTDNTIGEATDPDDVADAKDDLAKAEGWYIDMELGGEKILGSSATLNKVVKFVSYVPELVSDGCAANVGVSYYWAVNLLDGTPYDINAGDEDGADDGTGGTGSSTGTGPTKKDRKREIPSGGLSPAVSTVFVAGDDGTVIPVDMSGPDVVNEWDGIETLTREYWTEFPE